MKRMGYSTDILGNLIFVGIMQILSVFLYGTVNALKSCEVFEDIRKKYDISVQL